MQKASVKSRCNGGNRLSCSGGSLVRLFGATDYQSDPGLCDPKSSELFAANHFVKQDFLIYYSFSYNIIILFFHFPLFPFFPCFSFPSFFFEFLDMVVRF